MKHATKQSTLALILNGVSVLVLLLTVAASVFSNLANSASAQASSDRFELTYNANRFMNGSSYLTSEVRAYAATGDQVHYDNYWNEINNLKNRDIGVANMEEIGITEEEQGYIDQMSELSNSLVPLEEAAMEDVAAGRMEDALNYVYGPEYSSAIDQINTLKSTFLAKLDQRALGEVQRLRSISRGLQVAVYVALAAVAFMQVVTNLFIRRKFIRPITQIERDMILVSQGTLNSNLELEPDTSEIGQLIDAVLKTKHLLLTVIQDMTSVLHGMSEGDMDQSIRASYPNDFEPIKTATNTILDALNDTLSQLALSSRQVAGSANQVADGAQTLSQGTAQQTSAAEELTATINEISTHINKIAEHAANARGCSQGASRQLAVGNEKMQEPTKAMEDISSASLRIGSIIKTIEDIAFQTNILALNAAVEASRAGTAGKGFAVVADEVRSLADKSSQAAKDSAALIEGTLKLVENSSSLSRDTAQALEQVVSGAMESTEYIERIAAATEQQAGALQQVTDSLEQISCVVQNNAASAEESAASAAELTQQAATQQQLVDRFHLRSQG